MIRIEPTTEARFEEAFAVLGTVGRWLGDKGRRQRIALTSQADYEAWQAEGRNYMILSGDAIAGVLTLCFETLEDWPDIGGPVHFLRALATHPDFRGHGVGSAGVEFALSAVAPEPLYLDCVSDFLPDYYGSLGFEVVDRQTKVRSDGDWDITLMRCG